MSNRTIIFAALDAMSDTPRRILVISPYFAPEEHPRAHRWKTICETWAHTGHQVTVVCGKVKADKTYQSAVGLTVQRVGHASLRNRLFRIESGEVAVSGSQWLKGIWKWLFDLFSKWLRPRFFPDEANQLFLPGARRVLLDMLSKDHFDLIVTVSKPFSTHLLGAEIKKKHSALYWIADCGDPWVAGMPLAVPESKFTAAAQLEAETLALADCVAVTHARVAELLRRSYNLNHLLVVPPILSGAYNASDILPHRAPSRDDHIIELAYFGALYAPERDATLLMAWANAIRTTAPELGRRIRVRIYGTVQPGIAMQLMQEPMVHLVGQIERDEVVREMACADILLHLGNSNDFLLPSKLVEYIASNLPILHLGYHEADACTEFLSAWGQCYQVMVMRDGKFAEGDIQKLIPFLLGTDARRNQIHGQLHEACSPAAIASAYLSVLTS